MLSEKADSTRRICCLIASSEMWQVVCKDQREALKAGKGRETDSPLEPIAGNAAHLPASF